MPKAEISWKRVTEEGEKLQVYAQHVERDWKFFHRGKRYDVWQPVKEPPLEDWLELLDAMRERFRACPQIQQCYYVTGQVDFMLVFNVRDMEEYTALTREIFFEGGNVESFRTFVVMDRVKTGMRTVVG